jgi:hypothetical protein
MHFTQDSRGDYSFFTLKKKETRQSIASSFFEDVLASVSLFIVGVLLLPHLMQLSDWITKKKFPIEK